MSILHYENWDSAVPPAAPSGWTFQAGSGLVTAVAGPTPITSPNMIELPAGGAGYYAASWNTQDGVSGNVQVYGSGQFFGSSGLNTVAFSVFGRASSNTNPLGGTCYVAELANGTFTLYKYVTGTATWLSQISTFTVSLNLWYQILLTLNSSMLTVSLERLSDQFYLGSNGTWSSTPSTAIILSDSSITGQGYAGWAATATGSLPVYGDDWTLTALSAPSIPPRRPLIVHFPTAYYPAWSE